MAPALPLAIALALAAQAAPSVAPDTLVTFGKLESDLRPFAIHDNTTDETYQPETQEAAVILATKLILREGHSADLGLLQVNFPPQTPVREGLSIRDAFNPLHNMRTGAAILVAAYRTCQTREHGDEAMLRCAASYYNTGKQTEVGRRYAAHIWRTAAQIVPSIGRILAADFPSAAPGTGTTTTEARPTIVPDVTPRPNVSVYTRPAHAGHELVYSH